MKKLLIPVLMLSIMFLLSCSQLNDNPPDYVKEVVAYKEGSEGFMIYFILADASGKMTTSNGNITLTISETRNSYYFGIYEVKLYSTSFNVKKTDFKKANVGRGAFKHKVILCSIGRIAYSSFMNRPNAATGKVKLEFQRSDGQILKGEKAVFF
jgi:hypothetical protein